MFWLRTPNKKSETIYHETLYGETKQEVELLYCNKLDTFLFPPKVEHKGNQLETEPKENNPMPRTCEFVTEFDDLTKFFNDK